MKNIVFIVFCLLICSCNNSEKYYGKWTLDYFKTELRAPAQVTISEDSIIFNNGTFNLYDKYQIKIENNTVIIDTLSIKIKREKDTISFRNLFFIEDKSDSLLKANFGKPILDLELPKSLIKGLKDIDVKNLNYYIYFGKKANKNEYSLQLNDKYASIEDIPNFIHHERATKRHELIKFPNAIFYIDKSTPTKYLEDIFFNLSAINQLKLSLINNINLNFNDSLIQYNYEALKLRLPPLIKNDNYFTTKLKIPLAPPPPFELNLKQDSTLIVTLQKNKIYHKGKTITIDKLKEITSQVIKNKKVIVSLFDLQSDYSNFLEMTGVINTVYVEKRNKIALKKYNIPFDELEREKAVEIKMEYPIKHVWNYSIPHYNSLIENQGSFLGLNNLLEFF